MLARAGFAEARVHPWTGYRTWLCTQGRWCPRPDRVPGRPFKSAVEVHQGLECPRRLPNLGRVGSSRVDVPIRPIDLIVWPASNYGENLWPVGELGVGGDVDQQSFDPEGVSRARVSAPNQTTNAALSSLLATRFPTGPRTRNASRYKQKSNGNSAGWTAFPTGPDLNRLARFELTFVEVPSDPTDRAAPPAPLKPSSQAGRMGSRSVGDRAGTPRRCGSCDRGGAGQTPQAGRDRQVGSGLGQVGWATQLELSS